MFGWCLLAGAYKCFYDDDDDDDDGELL